MEAEKDPPVRLLGSYMLLAALLAGCDASWLLPHGEAGAGVEVSTGAVEMQSFSAWKVSEGDKGIFFFNPPWMLLDWEPFGAWEIGIERYSNDRYNLRCRVGLPCVDEITTPYLLRSGLIFEHGRTDEGEGYSVKSGVVVAWGDIWIPCEVLYEETNRETSEWGRWKAGIACPLSPGAGGMSRVHYWRGVSGTLAGRDGYTVDLEFMIHWAAPFAVHVKYDSAEGWVYGIVTGSYGGMDEVWEGRHWQVRIEGYENDKGRGLRIGVQIGFSPGKKKEKDWYEWQNAQ